MSCIPECRDKSEEEELHWRLTWPPNVCRPSFETVKKFHENTSERRLLRHAKFNSVFFKVIRFF